MTVCYFLNRHLMTLDYLQTGHPNPGLLYNSTIYYCGLFNMEDKNDSSRD